MSAAVNTTRGINIRGSDRYKDASKKKRRAFFSIIEISICRRASCC